MTFWLNFESVLIRESEISVKIFMKILSELIIFWKHTRFPVYFAEINFRMKKILRKFHANVEEILGDFKTFLTKLEKS